MDFFSRSFFKMFFWDIVLELVADAVPNVRLRMCRVMPVLKSILKHSAPDELARQVATGCYSRLAIAAVSIGL